jgi:DNA polymerase-3 subunit gamma/tau
MSYLAIARKYRPATFDEIVGQEHVTRTLRNAIDRDRVHHAFLFCGARGVGKTTAARALARSLNCETGPTADPCGTCTSCVEVTNGSSPDLIEIDGASNNSVDDVRDLRDTVLYAPTKGRYKIYLVDEVHMLTKAAFNALLKTLEEPPPHVIFIFATTEPNKILDTILSRVQRFDFKRIGVGALVERLREIAKAEGAVLSDAALRRIAQAGEGSMRDAQSLLDKVISFGSGADISDEAVVETLGLIDRDLLFHMLEGLITGQPAMCLDAIATVYDYGFELSQFTDELMDVLRNATLAALSPGAVKHVDVADAEIARLQALTEGVEPESLSRLFAALLEVHDQVSRAGRPRIVLEMAVARLATSRPVQPVGALLGRLEQLEKRIRGGGGSPGNGGLQGGGDRSRGTRRPAPKPGGHRAAPLARRSPDAPLPAPNRPTALPDMPPEPPPMPEPAYIEPPMHVDASAPQAVPDPWAAVCDVWKNLGDGAGRLAAAQAQLRGHVLRLSVPAGRELAEGERTAKQQSVLAAIERFYAPGTRLQIVALEGTGTAKDRMDALRREVREDPRMKPVIKAFGAKVDLVTSLGEPAPATPSPDVKTPADAERR